tara:strand:+ start:347 stop:511 length:165 start_codon:yes stop_codon:yes gene_type:complete
MLVIVSPVWNLYKQKSGDLQVWIFVYMISKMLAMYDVIVISAGVAGLKAASELR